MTVETKPENGQKPLPWSILDGEFMPDLLADYQEQLDSIKKKVYEQWDHGDIANRILAADIVQLAVTTCQPELFDGKNPDREKEIARDIGTSVFASYSFTSEQMDEVASLLSDVSSEQIPTLNALKAILMKSPFFLGEGKDLTAIGRTTVLHILAKQLGRAAELPRAVYNRP